MAATKSGKKNITEDLRKPPAQPASGGAEQSGEQQFTGKAEETAPTELETHEAAHLEEEPYSAQVARAVHEDLSMLHDDYGNMAKMLEHPEMREHIEGVRAGLHEMRKSTAQLFKKHHPDLKPQLEEETKSEETEEMEKKPEHEEVTATEEQAEDAARGKSKTMTEEEKEKERLEKEKCHMKSAAAKAYDARMAAFRQRNLEANTKRLSKSERGVVNEAAEFLEDLSSQENLTKLQKSATLWHGKALKGVAVDEVGNEFERTEETAPPDEPMESVAIKSMELEAIERELAAMESEMDAAEATVLQAVAK